MPTVSAIKGVDCNVICFPNTYTLEGDFIPLDSNLAFEQPGPAGKKIEGLSAFHYVESCFVTMSY